MTQPNPFLEFMEKYAMHPTLFVQEVLGADPDATQSAAMEAVAKGERRISLRSGHGVGKTTLLAWILTWWICTRFPQKSVCTAPTSGQLFDALAAETKTWIKKLPQFLQDCLEVKTESIHLIMAPTESFIAFKTSRQETPEALAGIHSENVLVIGDEASGIPEPVYEAAAGSMSGHNATTILAGNPVRSSGLFFDTFHKLRDKWCTFHISCVGHPRISPDFISDMESRYGIDSNAYRVRVLGEFPLADDDTVIPFELMESALDRDVKATFVLPIWGLDVARFGSDSSALAKRKGNVLLEKVIRWKGLDTMQICGRVKEIWDLTLPSERPTEINVDVIGMGAGVVDRLLELKLPVRGINVGESPSLGENFINLRAELWFKGKEWLAKKDCSLAGDEALGGELVAPKYTFTSSGKRQVESKKDMKKRGLKSPDSADAFLLTLASDAVSASGATVRSSWNEPLKRNIKGVQ